MPLAAAVVGAGALGAGATIFGASKAAKAQVKAAQIAAATQKAMYDQTRKDLSPFMTAGQGATDNITGNWDYFTSPIRMDQAALENTPGYQFTLNQGLKSIQNSAAARGLGVSGAAMKGAADYTTGLANKTYMDQFNLENINRSNAFNRLYNVATMGQNAAAGVGTMGMNAANGISQAYSNAGNAQAGAYMAGAGAINNGLNNAMGMYMMNNMTNGRMFGNGAGGGVYDITGAGSGLGSFPGQDAWIA